jgi:hypothetical protein
MQIREGAYYRTRGGRIVGPMNHVGYRAAKWSFCALGFQDGAPCWTDEGRWCEFDDSHDMDLISEVYVSDTPPANAPAPEAKTLRDEFAMAALTVAWEYAKRGSQSNLTITTTARLAYAFADEMMEARKK